MNDRRNMTRRLPNHGDRRKCTWCWLGTALAFQGGKFRA